MCKNPKLARKLTLLITLNTSLPQSGSGSIMLWEDFPSAGQIKMCPRLKIGSTFKDAWANLVETASQIHKNSYQCSEIWWMNNKKQHTSRLLFVVLHCFVNVYYIKFFIKLKIWLKGNTFAILINQNCRISRLVGQNVKYLGCRIVGGKKKPKPNLTFGTYFEGELAGRRNLWLRLWEMKFVYVVTWHSLCKNKIFTFLLKSYNFNIFITPENVCLNRTK